MSDFEYFSTIGAFVAGFVFLVYLFRIRAKLIRKVKLQLLQAKAKVHYMTRPQEDDILLPVDFEYIDVDDIKESATWDADTYRKREIR